MSYSPFYPAVSESAWEYSPVPVPAISPDAHFPSALRDPEKGFALDFHLGPEICLSDYCSDSIYS